MGHLWLTGWAFISLIGWGICHLMGGALWFNGWGTYGINGWGSTGKLLFHLEICSKNAGLQGSTLSVHRMTTGFGPFELLTCGLLQRGWDHSPPKACFYLRSPALRWLSQHYEYIVAKTKWGGAEWVGLL